MNTYLKRRVRLTCRTKLLPKEYERKIHDYYARGGNGSFSNPSADYPQATVFALETQPKSIPTILILSASADRPSLRNVCQLLQRVRSLELT